MSDTTIKANGSWVGDSVEEFKKLPPWGKFAAVGALVAVAGVGYYEYSKSKASGVNNAVGASQVASGQDLTSGGGGLQSPFSQIPSGSNANGVPLLPSGVQPLFDGAGTLIGWQPTQGTTNPTSTPPAPTMAQTPIPNLSGYKIWQGNQGRWWTGIPGKFQILLNNLFPSGTKFDYTNNKLSATAPGEKQSVVGTVITVAPPPVHKVTQTAPPPAPKMPISTVKK